MITLEAPYAAPGTFSATVHFDADVIAARVAKDTWICEIDGFLHLGIGGTRKAARKEVEGYYRSAVFWLNIFAIFFILG